MERLAPSKQEIALTVASISAFTTAIAELSGDPLMPLQQVQLLLQLHIHGRVMQNELPRYTGVESSAISRNITKLGQGTRAKKGLGLVEAYEDPADRRWNIVRLTRAGQSLLEESAKRAAVSQSQFRVT